MPLHRFGVESMESVSGCVSATSASGGFVSRIYIWPDDSSVFGERRSNHEHFLDRAALGHQRAIARLRIALHLFELLGGGVACSLTHRKRQSTLIDDLDQKKPQCIAHFKAARSEHCACLCFQKVVYTGSDYTAFHGYIVATLLPGLKLMSLSGRAPCGWPYPQAAQRGGRDVRGKTGHGRRPAID
jgi:hypothetical protein